MPFVVDSSLRFSSTSAHSMFGTGILTFGRHTVVIPLMRPTKCRRSENGLQNFFNDLPIGGSNDADP